MLLEYLQAALQQAKYEILPDDGSYYGEVPGCQGVYSQAPLLEACREELKVLEEWVLFRGHQHLPCPLSIENLSLLDDLISSPFNGGTGFQPVQ
jgi:predicted RNase H-like HicB family nuclease